MQIEHIGVDQLTPYARNSRTHSDAQVAQIVASIREYGFTNAILIDEQGGIIAGHGRVMAARKLGMQQVPCVRLSHLSDAQKRAYIIADNRLALNAGWDEAMLAIEFRDLSAEGYDLGLTGFDTKEIDELLATLDATPEGNIDPDETPPLQEVAVSQPGDVWQLGKHRLMCGDCTRADQVKTLLGGGKPMLMVTDPPYGVDYDPEWRKEAGVNNSDAKMGKVLNDARADWREAWALFGGNIAYVWHAGRFANVVQDSLEACEFEIRCQIIWAKDRFALSRGAYHWQHEPCWYAVRAKNNAHWCGDRSQTTLWPIKAREDGGHGHGTQKPVECMRRPIENHTNPGEEVYEPFSGSGTTIIAAEQTGRICYAMELAPQYVDVAVRRWQQFTGKRAVREADGMEFPAS